MVEATGRAHFRHNPDLSDEELYEAGYNRVYDTLEPEQNLDDVERVMHAVFVGLGRQRSDVLLQAQPGHRRASLEDGQGTAGHSQVSLRKQCAGLCAGVFGFRTRTGLTRLTNRERDKQGKPRFRFDPFEDLEYFAATLLAQKRLGIFTIGGGVPRNWSQQFGPFIELRHRRGGEDLPLKRYHYGLRICPEPVYWGGLSGSPTARLSRGESSFLRRKAESLARCLWMPR